MSNIYIDDIPGKIYKEFKKKAIDKNLSIKEAGRQALEEWSK